MSTASGAGYISKSRYLVSRGKGLGLPLTPREESTALALMDGKVTTDQLADALQCERGTVHWYLNQVYRKSGAVNLAHLVLMITGAVECPAALLPVQRAWRRKHYRLDAEG